MRRYRYIYIRINKSSQVQKEFFRVKATQIRKESRRSAQNERTQLYSLYAHYTRVSPNEFAYVRRWRLAAPMYDLRRTMYDLDYSALIPVRITNHHAPGIESLEDPANEKTTLEPLS